MRNDKVFKKPDIEYFQQRHSILSNPPFQKEVAAKGSRRIKVFSKIKEIKKIRNNQYSIRNTK